MENIVFWVIVGGGGFVAVLRVAQVYGEDVLSFVRWYDNVMQELRRRRTKE